jgi:hypothetical protein
LDVSPLSEGKVQQRPTVTAMWCSGSDRGWTERPVANGEIRGVPWSLRWSSIGGPQDGLQFHSDKAFGLLRPRADAAVTMTVNRVEEHAVVWGLVGADVIAVRVITHDGDATVGSVLGPDVEGSSAFLVILPPGREPEAVEVVDARGSALHRESVVPEPSNRGDVAARIDVTVISSRPVAAGETVILEGRVDDAAWKFAVSVRSDELRTDFELWDRRGGGGGRCSGPMPQPGPDRRLDVLETGTSDGLWHLTGWADPAATAVELHLRSGERLNLPTAGQHLDLGFVLFAVALPGEAVALVADAVAADGSRLARLDLRGNLSWPEPVLAKHRDDRRRAGAPVPTEIRQLWEATLETSFEEASPPHPRTGASTTASRPLIAADLAGQWPVRPLLIPTPSGSSSERWILHGEHHRGGISQGVGLGLLWYGGPDLPDEPSPDDWRAILERGGLILRQYVTWHEPEGDREPPNTNVRGRPGTLWEHNLDVNNIDHLALHWHEPATVGLHSPLSGVWCATEAHPQHHRVNDLRRFTEELRAIDA